VSRRDSRRGGGLIKGLSALLVVLVLLVLYLAWQNSIPLTDLPFLAFLAPLWFYAVLGILASAAIGASLRGRRPRARRVVPDPLIPEGSTAYEPPQETPEYPPYRRDRVTLDVLPAGRESPREEPSTAHSGASFLDYVPADDEPAPTPEPEPTPEPAPTPAVEPVAPNLHRPARPETLISRLLHWLEETSPEATTKGKPLGPAPAGKSRR
jgi:hypothetical protein